MIQVQGRFFKGAGNKKCMISQGTCYSCIYIYIFKYVNRMYLRCPPGSRFANTDADANREITLAKSFLRVIKLLTICESDEFTTGSVIVFHI